MIKMIITGSCKYWGNGTENWEKIFLKSLKTRGDASYAKNNK